MNNFRKGINNLRGGINILSMGIICSILFFFFIEMIIAQMWGTVVSMG